MRIGFFSLVFTIAFILLITSCGSTDQAAVETVVEVEATAQPATVETVIVEEPEESREYIIFENWIASELDVEITIEMDSTEEQSSISLIDREGRLRETVVGVVEGCLLSGKDVDLAGGGGECRSHLS